MKKSSWLFLITLSLGTMITISSNSWISMWIGLELNMMSFIPLMLMKINKSSSEASMIYFMVQSMSSMILMMMITINMWNYLISSKTMNIMITIALMIKLGAAPFHLWLPEIMSKMEWSKCNILMTWQKIAPMYMLSNLENNSLVINMSIYLSIIVGSTGGMIQTSIRKMMGYSSINHLGWMMAMTKMVNNWVLYLMIYSILLTLMCKTFSNKNLYFINQLSGINMSNMEKVSLFMMMLSFGGLPPFLGFLPKWITIQSMIHEYEMLMLLTMIMFSLITLMYYTRIMTNMMLSHSVSMKWQSIKINKSFTLTTIIINLSLPLIMMLDIF